MSGAQGRAFRLPVLGLALYLAVQGGAFWLPWALVGLTTLAWIWPDRVSLSMATQLLLALIGVVLAFVATSQLMPERMGGGNLSALWVFVSLTGLTVAIPRLFTAAPLGGAQVTAAMGLVTLMALGGVTAPAVWAPMVYAALCLAWILLCLERLGSLDRAFASSRDRRYRSGALRVTVVGAMMAA